MEISAFDAYCHNLKAELPGLIQKYEHPEYYADALALIRECQAKGKRLHVSGIGKPHHLSGYFASLFSSIGCQTYLLDGTEATHGSLGQVDPGDVVILLSYYGNPTELVKTAQSLRQMHVKMISVTGFDESEIARLSDVHLNVCIGKEGDPLNMPPRLSMLSTMICLQNLSVLLQLERGLTLEEYLTWHPNGQIGRAQR